MPAQFKGQHSWEQLTVPFLRGTGLVCEIDDPLRWGLDLEDEAITAEGSCEGPHSYRLLRTYRCFTGIQVDVETLPVPSPRYLVEDVVRAAAASALAAPLHDDVDKQASGLSFAAYRAALRDIVQAVDAQPLCPARVKVDGVWRAATRVEVSGAVGLYVRTHGRGLVIAGPAPVVDTIPLSMRPVRALLGLDTAYSDIDEK